MIFASWNVRGLNKSARQAEVTSFLTSTCLSCMCILETKVREKNFVVNRKFLGDNWVVAANYKFSNIGRIWLVWDSSRIKLSSVFKSSQMIHGYLETVDGKHIFWISMVYGLHTIVDHQSMWED